MSAQELMKKHYIIQQKVFREKKTIGLSLNLQTLKVRLNPVRRPGSLSTEVDLAGGRLVLSDGRSKAFHLRFVLNTGDCWAIRSLTLPAKGDSSLNLALNLQVLTRKLPLANRPRHVVSENESPVFRTNRLQNRLQNRIQKRPQNMNKHERTRIRTNMNKHEQT